MQIHQIVKSKHLKSRRRVGRGGKRGTYSGRGMKGQKSRSGARIRPDIRDYIEKIPKLRGMTRKSNESPFGRGTKKKRPITVVNIGVLNRVIHEGDLVNIKFLLDKNIVRKYKGRAPIVKILAKGELKKKIIIEGLLYSSKAKEAVEKNGGTVK